MHAMDQSSSRAAHRPLRADDAAGRPAQRGRAPALRSSRSSPGGCPTGRRYGVVAGHRPGARRARATSASTTRSSPSCATARSSTRRPCDWLAGYRFSGDIDGYPEGECYFPGSPILTVEGTFAEAVLLETLVAVDPQPRLRDRRRGRPGWSRAAGGRPLIEMGSRRTHEEAAVAAARAAYLAGFAATSNLEAGRRYGMPDRRAPRPTPSRCCTTASATPSPPRSPSLGRGTTLLVDTYDVDAGRTDRGRGRRPRARRRPHRLRRPGRRSPTQVREQLDALGATETRIVVTGDLDEYAIAALAAAPVDATASAPRWSPAPARPTAGVVYKLVAREDADGLVRPVAKQSAGKTSAAAARTPSAGSTPTGRRSPRWSASPGDPPERNDRDRSRSSWSRDGEIVGREPLERVRGAAPATRSPSSRPVAASALPGLRRRSRPCSTRHLGRPWP